MIKFINGVTGSEMWVAEDRVEEYKVAGHKLATDSKSEKPADVKPKKKVTKKK